ncbi:response regulator [Brucepastera parasyntrophica]|uniref:response regulator n=1 Tax=Brucepastera parasyntrophica TaxID=2880008 RepID=UPI00210CB69A|nr:response regulator [Brucepastera parasyntrophica]ULQ59260.1 response regulator [Brucepastera parasyntrophica]
MHILIVDDEEYILGELRNTVENLFPEHSLSCFDNAEDALSCAAENSVDVALLDVELSEMSGLDLALHLKALNNKTNIIFVTAYGDYMGNAFSMHASGYILKPAGKDEIERELRNLRYPVDDSERTPVRMHCFGNFEVYVHGKLLPMTRSKSKELLAYLVHKNGSSVTKKEIAAVLWENRGYTRSLQQQIRKIMIRLEQILSDAGVDGLVRRYWGQISIDTNMYTSDYIDFLNGDVRALNTFCGEYMAEYSWGESTTGILTGLMPKKEELSGI